MFVIKTREGYYLTDLAPPDGTTPVSYNVTVFPCQPWLLQYIQQIHKANTDIKEFLTLSINVSCIKLPKLLPSHNLPNSIMIIIKPFLYSRK